MDSSKQKNSRRTWRLIALVAILVSAAALAYAAYNTECISRESVIYEQIARQLAENTTEGRQAAVSSVWWPPFCTLARLPLVVVFPGDGFPWASVVVGAISGTLLIMLLWRCSRMLAGRLRTILICAILAASPFFVRELVSGSTRLLIVLLAVMCADSLARWLSGRGVRNLVSFAISGALIVGLSFEHSVWLLMMLCVFLADAVLSKSMSRRHKEAVLLMGLLPALYAASLWFLMNWLIMGDVLYFLRPLWEAKILPTVAGEGRVELGLLDYACGLIPAFTAGVAAGTRNRMGLLWSMFALLLFVTVIIFDQMGMLWENSHIQGTLPVFVFFTTVAAAGHIDGHRVASWRRMLLILPVALSALSYSIDAPRGRGLTDDSELLPAMERHALARSRWAKVFVCGYDSFALLRGRSSDVFEYALDFNFNKAKNDYHGHGLFIMIKKPEGKGTGDSIHWKYPDIYTLGSEGTLYTADWGDWRMFEIVQAPEGSNR